MISDRWLKVGAILGIVVCVAFADACGGGGGGGGGGGSTTVAMALSFPSGAAKPSLPNGGASQAAGDAIGTDTAGATAAVITSDGTATAMTDNGDGTYSCAVPDLVEGDSFIIEARKGTLELSLLVSNFTILGTSTTFDAGIVDTTSTAFTEIVREIVDAPDSTITLAGDVSDAASGNDYLIQSIAAIEAAIDLLQLYTQVLTAFNTGDPGNVSTYDEIVAAVQAACAAASVTDTTTTASTLTDGTLDRGATGAFADIGSVTLPSTSTDGPAVLAVIEALLNASIAQDAVAAGALMDGTLLWNGATKTETLANWALEWAGNTSVGIDSAFTGIFLSQEITPGVRWKLGLKGTWIGRNSSGTILQWAYQSDDFNSDGHWFYVDKIGSDWLSVGDQQKQLVEITYVCGKFWDTSNTVPGSPWSTWRYLYAAAGQAFTSIPANLIVSGTVTGSGSIFSPPVVLIKSDNGYASWSWKTSANLGVSDPSLLDTYTFDLAYSDASTAAPTTTVPPLFTSLDDLTEMTFLTLTATASSIDFTWGAPDLKAEVIGLDVMLRDTSGTDIHSESVVPTTTSMSISTSDLGLVSGTTYAIKIQYTDAYFNEYTLQKNFIMP